MINREALRNGQDALLALCMGAAAYLAIAILNTSLEQVIVIGVILQRTVKGFGRLQGFLQQAVIVESPFKEVELIGARRQPGGLGRQASAAFEREISCEAASVRLRQAAGAQRHQSDRAGRQHHGPHRHVGSRARRR